MQNNNNIQWYTQSITEVARAVRASIEQGLTTLEAEKRLAMYGKNELPKEKRLRPHILFVRQFKNPLIFILLIAAGLTFFLDIYSEVSHITDVVVILLAVLVNTLIGFVQEWKSGNVFDRLRKLVAQNARVIRGGKVFEIPATELVPGDTLLLYEGVKVPADARLVEVEHLEVNESLLTGEAGAVQKSVAAIGENVVVGDRTNMVHLGTAVERGNGKAIVVGTGAHTEMGNIALLTSKTDSGSTPLGERLARLGRVIAVFILVVSIIIFGVGVAEGREIIDMFTIAIAVMVAAIPEGLPAALSVVLAVAASRILKRKGLVKKLIGAETLGSATVIVTDKTGTLTEGVMEVEEFLWGKEDATARVFALANSAIVEEVGSHKIRGEETDQAKMRWFLKSGGDIKKLSEQYPKSAFIEFDSKRKYIASFHERAKGLPYIAVSGAPEALIQLSTLKKTEKEELLAKVEKYAKKGYRVIAAAEKQTRKAIEEHDDIEVLHGAIERVRLVGLVALRDPIRKDVCDVVRSARKAGIRIIMATGDHRLTGVAIGEELGFAVEDEAVLLGEEIEALDDDTLRTRMRTVAICARVSPEHKIRIVHALKSEGEVVAMTGDGVNDAPAVKAADIGVAFNSGSDATKEAADLVLIENGFSVIAEAIREGRIAFDNTRKVTVFLLTNSFTEIVLILTSLILQLPLPITAVQILWANLVADGLPNFALAFEHGEPDVMERKPIPRNTPILDRESISIIAAIGVIANCFLVAIFLFLLQSDQYSIEYIRTFIFSMIATNALIYMFAIKSLRRPIFRAHMFDNPYLLFSVVVGFVIIGASIYVTPLQDLLKTVALEPFFVVAIFAVGLLQLAMIEVVKWTFYRKSYIV